MFLLPPHGNQKADALANGDHAVFIVELRVPRISGTLDWDLLPDAFRTGRIAEQGYVRAKQSGTLPVRARKQCQRKP